MKTTLPEKISTIEEARAFLKELHKNVEHYHPEDDAHDIVNYLDYTVEECDQLNKLMQDIYALPGNDSPQNMAFDPCVYLLFLDVDTTKPVRLRDPENEQEKELIYIVVNSNEVTCRYQIKPTKSNLSIPPIETVGVLDIENIHEYESQRH